MLVIEKHFSCTLWSADLQKYKAKNSLKNIDQCLFIILPPNHAIILDNTKNKQVLSLMFEDK